MTLPLPSHFDPARVGEVFRVPYEERARQARAFAREHGLEPSSHDDRSVGLLLIDVQNTFCLPDFELFVGGRSGTGAVDDNRRLCQFLYRNLDRITRIHVTLDTHSATQIFHSAFLVDQHGKPPAPMTTVSLADVEAGRIRVSPQVAETGIGQDYLEHYCRRLSEGGKYELLVWPFHAMLGGIGHALVASVEEAVFFHDIARESQTGFELKGRDPRTENYSALRAEVVEDQHGERFCAPNDALVEELLAYDALVVAGQAKSHCVASTVSDLRAAAEGRGLGLTERIFLLEDCTSPVVVPDVVDFTESAEARFREFAHSGMHVVRSTDALETWAGFPVTVRSERR